jgi:tryptophan synthase alpha chain
MGRITDMFEKLNASGRSALIPYVTAGDPDLDTTFEILDALVRGGADLIEVGIPFSDPMADGPVIQLAMERALANNITLSEILESVARFRKKHAEIPLVLFGYMNPFYAYGLEALSVDAAQAGIDGFLVVDLPPESAAELTSHLKPRGLDFISLFTPTTDLARIDSIARHASGFAYCVSVTGVTGGSLTDHPDLEKRVTMIREHTGLPTAVGFGVRTPQDAARVSAFADGVVVGSALVNKLANKEPDEICRIAFEYTQKLREALTVAKVLPFPSAPKGSPKG